MRPRTILYAALIVIVRAIMVVGLATRATLGVSAHHDRNPHYVRLADGSVRNMTHADAAADTGRPLTGRKVMLMLISSFSLIFASGAFAGLFGPWLAQQAERFYFVFDLI
jgi:hypothetical protein